MDKHIIKTTKKVIPMCYAYTTPGVTYHEGWTKIGYTERDVDTRIKEQTQTANIKYNKEWAEEARFSDGSGDTFTDKEFHTYLAKNDIKRKDPEPDDEGCPEWFQISGEDSQKLFWRFKADRGIMESLTEAMPYILRKEQEEFVSNTLDYFDKNKENNPEVLWNAKPRFGKTLTAYDLCKALNAEKVLIVTNRPVIANSWYQDYEKFLGTKSGYYFVSNTDSLKNKKYVISREEYLKHVDEKEHKGCIEFVSLQDLKGSIHFGGEYEKLEEVANLNWDILIIDEAHEGVDTFKTDIAFEHIHRKYTLHLSGTPFKALANDKFEKEAICNWTYADEQQAKRNWSSESEYENPYENLPKLNLLTYKMSDIVLEKVAQGQDFDNDGDNEAYAFDLNEFFMTNESGNFIHDKDVDKFLDALTTQKKFPFSTEELRNELKHTLWILKYVSSAKALAKKLKAHELFKEYEIVLAAGDGEINDNDEEINDTTMDRTIKKSYDKVVNAIENNAKTITISVGQLTTGITIPEWTGVIMLSNMQSPALYMQAAFRAQNPCLFNIDGETYRKENAYVFDFDPARTLDIFEQFANGLSEDTVNGRGDTETRKRHIKELLNFFPVYGEDEDGEMIELDAEKVLSIPRSIHAKEVVKRGFMSNFLFQNISGIFSAPSVVKDIIDKLEPTKEPTNVNDKTRDELNINDNGEVDIPESNIIGTANEIFGEKIYAETEESINSVISNSELNNNSREDTLRQLKEIIHSNTDEIVSTAKESYGNDMSKSAQNEITRTINREADREIERHYGEYNINRNLIESDRENAIKVAEDEGRYDEIGKINSDFDEKQKQNNKEFENNILNAIHNITENGEKTAVEVTEKDIKRKEKEGIEEQVRDHLRGFSRTIPSFLMGYGNDETTLENFDTIIPAEVFLEVTGITVEDFKFLRDGGEYPDPEDENKMKHFDGNLFEPIVFNDSVKEFLRKRDELADYFEENAKEDIFDYIPPQRTNQIYTPKKVVKQMVDYLEEENPNCFDDPKATFIDLYMKSGLYITEIVKRLYRSEKMIELYPNEDERLKHIFENQVYGCAPTEIIYMIATHYILGFSKNKDIKISSKHFKLFDTLPSSQAGTLEEDLDKIFKE